MGPEETAEELGWERRNIWVAGVCLARECCTPLWDFLVDRVWWEGSMMHICGSLFYPPWGSTPLQSSGQSGRNHRSVYQTNARCLRSEHLLSRETRARVARDAMHRLERREQGHCAPRPLGLCWGARTGITLGILTEGGLKGWNDLQTKDGFCLFCIKLGLHVVKWLQECFWTSMSNSGRSWKWFHFGKDQVEAKWEAGKHSGLTGGNSRQVGTCGAKTKGKKALMRSLHVTKFFWL